jgi:2-C-methyl-D-erythritol 4-phosphate cytidylyltransferase
MGGRPLLEYSLDLLSHARCSPIVLVVPERSMVEARALFGTREGLVFAVGGETRQDSVASGLEEVSTEVVVVHDGARPFADVELVRRVVAALSDADGAIAAMPSDETLKRVEGDMISGTVDRSHLWRAQTPQAFRTQVLREAHAKARAEGYVDTDDAALLERYGGTVRIVQGARSNIKLTYPEDFALAEAILRGGLR